MDVKSNEPFWLVKNGIPESYPSLGESIQADILVVGGGITGSLLAHACVENGYDTVLADRREIAHGSTSATTSMLQYEIDIPLFKLQELIGREAATASYLACHRAIDVLGELSVQIKSGCGFKKKKSLYYAAYKKDVADMRKEFEARKEAGIPVRWLEEAEIYRQFGLNCAYGGILSRQGGSLDAFKLVHDLLSYNQKKGLRIFDKTPVKVKEYKARSTVFETDRGHEIRAGKTIYCTGYESTELLDENFVKLLSTYAIVGERQEEGHSQLEEVLIWNSAEPYNYMRTTDDCRLLIGGEDEEFVNPVKRDALLGDKSAVLRKKLLKLLPDYDFRTDFVWAGTFGETKDGLPYIGDHPKFPNSFFVLGFGGNGIVFSVLGMEMIMNALKKKKHPLQSCFRFGR